MPKNRIIYYGIVVLCATILLWIGAELTKRIEWMLPYFAGAGVVMVVGGFVFELWKSRRAANGTSRSSFAHPDHPDHRPK